MGLFSKTATNRVDELIKALDNFAAFHKEVKFVSANFNYSMEQRTRKAIENAQYIKTLISTNEKVIDFSKFDEWEKSPQELDKNHVQQEISSWNQKDKARFKIILDNISKAIKELRNKLQEEHLLA